MRTVLRLRIILIACWLLGLPLLANGAHCPFAVQWDLSANHPGIQQLVRVHQTADGGYVAGGTGYGTPGGFWVIRLDPRGVKLWERFYGNGGGSEILFDLQLASDGGFVLGGASSSRPFAGKTSPNYGDYDFWLVRLDAQGNQLWDRSFGGSGFDGIYGFQQTADGGYILGGISGSPPDGNKTSGHFGSRDFWAVRCDANGNKLWDQSYGGTGTEFWGRARLTTDGGFVMVGTTASGADGNKTTPHFGGDDVWVVRADAAGNKIWDQTYGGTAWEYPGEILQTPDGGFIVSAWSQSGADGNKTSPSLGGSDGWVLRLNSDGSRQWEQVFGGAVSDTLYSMARTSDGGYILGGFTDAGPGNAVTWLVALDAQGAKLWDQTVAGGIQSDVEQTSDGGFVMAGDSFHGGETLVDGWVLKLGPGRVTCDNDGDGVPNDRDQCPNTPANAVVNAQGCSIAQLCPCEGPWQNHSEYLQCVMERASDFFDQGLIDENERKQITRAAAKSDCGKRP
jgi:hypothetical protein